MNITTVVQDPVEVLGLTATNGVSGAKEAFRQVESRLPTLRGRKFYATLDQHGCYRACFARNNDDDPASLKLEQWTLPGGLYARTILPDWPQHLSRIGPSFAAMAALHPPDPARPSIEFYRSQKELILLMPITDAGET